MDKVESNHARKKRLNGLKKETGQYYYRARMYSAEQSRFTTQDPAGMQDSVNMYAYVGNNPVNKRDPSGLASAEEECKIYCSIVGCGAACTYFAATIIGGIACAALCTGGCWCLCAELFGDGCGGAGGPPPGAVCTKGDAKWWGYPVTCNRKATTYLDDRIGSGASQLGSAFAALLVGATISSITGGGFLTWTYFSWKIDSCDEQQKKLRINVFWVEPVPELECV